MTQHGGAVNAEITMGFRCPRCQNTKLEIALSMELGADNRSDERSLQVAVCEQCGLHAVLTYEESRRGGGESWHHVGYRLPKDRVLEIRDSIAGCSSPRDGRCACASHAAAREVDPARESGNDWFNVAR